MILINIFGYGQSVSLKSSIGITDNLLYINPLSLGLGISYRFKKNELIAELQYSKFNTNSVTEFDFHPLDQQYMTTCAIWVKTKAFSFDISQLYNLKKNDNASLSIGPSIGLSLYNGIKELYYYPTNGLDKVRYRYTYKNYVKPSLGFVLKTEIFKIMTEKMSFFMTISPKFYFYNNSIKDGSIRIEPSIFMWTNFGIGLKYDLK